MNQRAWFHNIIRTWWPLAASWLLMSLEGPAISATIARLANPEINLAAYGGVVFPLALLIEAPVIMLLAASTTLCKDWDSYRKIYRFMMLLSATLTLLHLVVAFTPLFDVFALRVISAPPEILEPARLGLRVMLPWTWSIAYRRFQQGVMIRFGHSRLVGSGTLVRLSVILALLVTGYVTGLPGILAATAAQAAGVMAEAAYAGIRIQPILRGQVRLAAPAEPLTTREFIHFYLPLALTSLLTLGWQPIASAALGRMLNPLASLAVLPVTSGLVFMFRSVGMAFNEVVVALIDEPHAYRALRRFAFILTSVIALLALLMALPPVSALWFGKVSGLSPDLLRLAQSAFRLAALASLLSPLQSWFQGAILYSRRTRAIPESISAFLLTVLAGLIIGGSLFKVTGLLIAMTSFSLANLAQTIWLWARSRAVLHSVRLRDEALQ